MKNTISLPVNESAAVAPGQKASGATDTPASSTPAARAEPAEKQATRRDPLMERMPPQVRKLLEKRAAEKAAASPEGASTPPPQAAAMPAPATPSKPEDKPTASEEAKHEDKPEAGVIDFAELGKTADAPDGDEPPALPTDEELGDVTVAKKKIEEAHKENAKLRKQRREEREAKERYEAELKTLREEAEALRAESSRPRMGSYLDRYTTPEQIEDAREDALEALRQLQENPERDMILLPGNRPWKIVTDEGESQAAQVAQTAFDILKNADTRLKQLTTRSAAEKMAAEKLPLLTRAVPDFQKRYEAALKSDWQAEAPALSLKAAIGELVVSGDYVLRPREKAAAKPAAPAKAAKEPANDLPNTPPAARDSDGGTDLAALKQRALKGDSKAMREWIRQSGKKAA